MEIKQHKKVLVLRFSALGDVAMTIPAIYSVAKHYPHVKFVVVSRPFFCRIFINAPSNVSTLPIDLRDYRGVGGIYRLIKLLRSQHADYVADLHNVLRTWIIDATFYLTGYRVAMLDKHRYQRIKLRNKKQQRPFAIRYFDVFEKLGLKASPTFSSVFDKKNTKLLPNNIPPKSKYKWIGIAPFARYVNKSYPSIYGQELLKQLSLIPNTRFFLFGGRENLPFVNTWIGNNDNITCLIGKYSIEQEIGVMSQLDLMISMDSANMHLASLVGTRVISIWGATTPSCGFLGWNQNEEDVIYVGLPCQPCTIAGSNKCKTNNFQCLKEITPQIVCQKIISILNKDDKI